MDGIASFISPEKDAFYLIGEERAKQRFVRNMLTQTDWSVEQIAEMVEVSLEFVQEVWQKMTDTQ